MTAYMTMVAAVHDTERGQRAVERAIELAAANGATLRLVAAEDGAKPQAAAAGHAEGGDRDVEMSPTPTEQTLERAARSAEGRNVPRVEYVRRRGNPVDVLISEASGANAGVVVVGSHGVNTAAGRLFGSVAKRTAQRSPCDVLIAHTTTERRARRRPVQVPYARIVVGVHRSTRDPDSTARVVARAAAVAADCDAVLHLVSAYQPESGHVVDDADWYLGARASFQVHGSNPAESDLAQADKIAQEHGATRRQRTPRRGSNPSKVLVDAADALDTDLVVVGSHGLNAAGGRMLGAVAATVFRRTPADVLIVNTS